MSTTCLLCCQDSQVWIVPPCNHQNICWKCCLKLIQSNIFICPFCKHGPQQRSQLVFATTEEMLGSDYQTLLDKGPFVSYKNTSYFYTNEKVAHYIEAETSYHCVKCGQVHENLNFLRKHLSSSHRVQFCDVCLDNRKCIVAEQPLYTEYQLQKHQRQGQLSSTGQVVLYHPICQFCNRRFYDLQCLKYHLRQSTHLKCQLCDKNCPRLKYVYYKNFQDLELHHRKTHYVCDIGDCPSRKLENVFVSQQLLENHKRNVHRKYKGNVGIVKTENILFGFNKKQEEELIQFDGIGRDLIHEFTIFDGQQSQLEKQEHTNEEIDIREFYPELVKTNMRVKVEEIVDKLNGLHSTYGAKRASEIEFNQLPIYKPLLMPALHRNECERLVKRSVGGREGDSILDIFFNKRMEYKSTVEWFVVIEKKLKNASGFVFFLVFPQLIRFLRDYNKGKIPMDQYYAQKLRLLPVTRSFIFHSLTTYSELIEYTKQQVESQMVIRLEQKTLDLQQYAQFLKDMNMTFYIKKQEKIFWVSRQKMTHIYHMIEHCKTGDFLKLNWLLKVGLSTTSYETIRKYYYMTGKEKGKRVFGEVTVQELALMNAYYGVCLQAILDEMAFSKSKKTPRAHFLTQMIEQLPKYPSISTRQVNELKLLEGRSDSLLQKYSFKPIKGVIIDDSDCPSLLEPIDLTKPQIKNKEDERIHIFTGKSLPNQWNEETHIRNKKVEKRTQQHDEFPTLYIGPNRTNGGANINGMKKNKNKKREEQKEPEQDFPVFNFKDKFVSVKDQQQEKKGEFDSFIGFNSKTVSHGYWDEDRTRKKMAEREKQMEKQPKKIRKKGGWIEEDERRAPMNQSRQTPKDNQSEDEYLRLAIAESLKTAEKEEERRKDRKTELIEVIIPKKAKFIGDMDQSFSRNGKKGKKNQNKNTSMTNSSFVSSKVSKIKIEDQPLFARIQQQQKQVKRQQNFRLDLSDEDEQIKMQKQKEQDKKQQKKKQRILQNNNKPIFIDDDFESLIDVRPTQQVSIITKIMKDSQGQLQLPVEEKRYKNKKRKRRADPSP